MMRIGKILLLHLIVLSCSLSLQAQELFVYSEPASNMATKSIGLRLNNNLMQRKGSGSSDFFTNLEAMVGVNKNLMLHAEIFAADNKKSFGLRGAGLYGKYRIYSEDGVHEHFRIAVYGRYSYIRPGGAKEAINLQMNTSGYEAGIVSTKLVNKYAISAGAAFAEATSSLNKINGKNNTAVNYNLALGKLILPKEYVSYDQLNMNLMLEVLGQANLVTGHHFVDLAPSVQFIIKSKSRIDLGYRFQVQNSIDRSYDRGFLIRYEYNFFNAW